MGGQRVSAPEEGDQGVVPDGGRCMAGWGVTYAVSTAQPRAPGRPGCSRAGRRWTRGLCLSQCSRAAGRHSSAAPLAGASVLSPWAPAPWQAGPRRPRPPATAKTWRPWPRQPRPGGGGDSRSAVRRVLGGGAHIRYPAGTTLGDDSGWRPRPPALGAERGGALEEANTQSRRGRGKTRAPSAPPA